MNEQPHKHRSWMYSFGCAFSGIGYALRTQGHMKFHAAAAIATIALAALCGVSKQDWLWLLLAITLVISAELINTAIEAVVDLVTTRQHPLAKIAKDVAAGAVLATAVFALMVAVFVFAEPVKQLWLKLL